MKRTKNFSANLGLQTAKYSSLVGTVIFLAFCITSYEALPIFGFFYILAAVAINGIFLFALIIETLVNANDRRELLTTIGIMLLNIPLAFIYATIALNL